MRDETFGALLAVLPIEGSSATGYRMSGRVDPVVAALPEEWATAAHAVLEEGAAEDRVAAGDRELWSALNGHRRGEDERMRDLFRRVRAKTRGIPATADVELVVRVRRPAAHAVEDRERASADRLDALERRAAEALRSWYGRSLDGDDAAFWAQKGIEAMRLAVAEEAGS